MNKLLQGMIWFYAIVLAVLSLTGLIPWFLSSNLHGIPLLLHMAATPLFVLGILGLAFFYPFEFRDTRPLRDISFWITIALSLPLMLSSIITMYPLLDLHGQDVMFTIHRYCALLITLSSLFFLSYSMRTKYFENDAQPSHYG